MSSHDALIADLVSELRPVRRLPLPALRAAGWLALVVATACALAAYSDLAAMRHRLMAEPDMWLAVLGSTLTAGLAVVAAFELDLPDRSRAWALLPLPGLALWIGASGMGCARTVLIPGTHDASMMESGRCLTFIIGLSIPLSVALYLMLRRGFSLNPSLTGAVAGLAVAAAAATLLNFFHPYDAALEDLAVHAVAVTLVVIANRLVAARSLSRPRELAALPSGAG